MVVSNYSDVQTDQLAKLIDSKLDEKYKLIVEDVYTSFPEKGDYNYANPSSDPRGNAGVLRQASRNLRAKATKLLEKELKQARKASRFSLQDSVEGRSDLESAAKLGSRTAQRLAKSTVSTGTKKTGEEPIRLGPLQAGEKEALLYRGRRRVVLEEERVTKPNPDARQIRPAIPASGYGGPSLNRPLQSRSTQPV
jgi:hypothetical protein